MKWAFGIVGLLLVAFFGLGLVKSNSPEGQAKARERDGIERCWAEQRRASLGATEKQFAAKACERMEDTFRNRYGVNP